MSDVVQLLADALRTGSDRPPGGLTRSELIEALEKEIGCKLSTNAVERVILQMKRAGKIRPVCGSEAVSGRRVQRVWYVPAPAGSGGTN